MNIKSVVVHRLKTPMLEKGNASMWFYGSAKVELEDGIVIRAIKIKTSTKNGVTTMFLDYPTQKGSDGVYRPTFFTNTPEARIELTAAVHAEYLRMKNAPQETPPEL